MVKEDLFTHCIDILHAYEDSHGLRHTPEREWILHSLLEHPGTFTPTELYQWVSPHRVSRATVYNTLELFQSAQILHCLRQQTNSKRMQYEVALIPTNHIQRKCLRCGRVSDIKDPAIKKLIFDRRYTNFSISHFSLYIYGTCRICRKMKADK